MGLGDRHHIGLEVGTPLAFQKTLGSASLHSNPAQNPQLRKFAQCSRVIADICPRPVGAEKSTRDRVVVI